MKAKITVEWLNDWTNNEIYDAPYNEFWALKTILRECLKQVFKGSARKTDDANVYVPESGLMIKMFWWSKLKRFSQINGFLVS